MYTMQNNDIGLLTKSGIIAKYDNQNFKLR